MAIEKETVILSFNKESLLELRKILFREKITLQSFHSYVIELVIMNDHRLEEIIKEIPKVKNKIKAKSNKNDADTLYAMIEQQLNKKTKTE